MHCECPWEAFNHITCSHIADQRRNLTYTLTSSPNPHPGPHPSNFNANKIDWLEDTTVHRAFLLIDFNLDERSLQQKCAIFFPAFLEGSWCSFSHKKITHVNQYSLQQNKNTKAADNAIDVLLPIAPLQPLDSLQLLCSTVLSDRATSS